MPKWMERQGQSLMCLMARDNIERVCCTLLLSCCLTLSSSIEMVYSHTGTGKAMPYAHEGCIKLQNGAL